MTDIMCELMQQALSCDFYHNVYVHSIGVIFNNWPHVILTYLGISP